MKLLLVEWTHPMKNEGSKLNDAVMTENFPEIKDIVNTILYKCRKLFKDKYTIEVINDVIEEFEDLLTEDEFKQAQAEGAYTEYDNFKEYYEETLNNFYDFCDEYDILLQ